MANKQALGNDIYPFYLTLGEYYYQCGQLDSAKIYLEQCLEKAVRLDTRAGAVYHLSKIALSTKQWILYAELSQRYEMMRDTLDQIEVTNTIKNGQCKPTDGCNQSYLPFDSSTNHLSFV